jgi:hypothetical protein
VVHWDTGVSIVSDLVSTCVLERDGGIVLERFPEGQQLLSVTGTWVTLRNLDNGVISIFRR